jgi:hypothetical protein
MMGNIQWQNTIGGSSDDLYCIQQTTDGGYILGGTSIQLSQEIKRRIVREFMDYWIIKTDSGGNIQWQNTIGGNSDDLLSSVEQTSDGGYILGGSSFPNIWR